MRRRPRKDVHNGDDGGSSLVLVGLSPRSSRRRWSRGPPAGQDRRCRGAGDGLDGDGGARPGPPAGRRAGLHSELRFALELWAAVTGDDGVCPGVKRRPDSRRPVLRWPGHRLPPRRRSARSGRVTLCRRPAGSGLAVERFERLQPIRGHLEIRRCQLVEWRSAAVEEGAAAPASAVFGRVPPRCGFERSELTSLVVASTGSARFTRLAWLPEDPVVARARWTGSWCGGAGGRRPTNPGRSSDRGRDEPGFGA